jgi:lipoprotein NlpD
MTTPHSLAAPARRTRIEAVACGAFAALVLVGCASPTALNRAPVEERSLPTRPTVVTASASPAPTAGTDAPASTPPSLTPRPALNAENAGKPGYYTVRPGDTLIRIGLETGQNWKDLMRWNNFENPNLIEVGQVLRVVPPGADPNAVTTRPVTASRVETRPLDAPKGTTPSTAAATAGSTAAAATASATSAAAAAASTAAAAAAATPTAAANGSKGDGDDGISWLWPAKGNVVANFDESRTKGLTIAGKAGDPVLAAADGQVVYAGSGLRGYGNLVILKHNNTYLTAYAHNQKLLVKEDQAVKRGQKIAEMGQSDAERVQLHFEIRRQGKPVDPAKLLPPR